LPFAPLPQRKSDRRANPGHSAPDFVRGRNVTELVASVASKLFEAVKLADVNTLLDQQILVNWIETAASRGCWTHFKA
jgi:hypothetical protein